MALLVLKAPAQDGLSLSHSRTCAPRVLPQLGVGKGDAQNSWVRQPFLWKSCKDKLQTKTGLFVGLPFQSCLFVCSQCFHPLDAKAIVPGIPTHREIFFPASELPRADLQTRICASHLSCHLRCLRISSILQLPAPSIIPWHRAMGLEIISQQHGWQSTSLIKHNLLSCTSTGPAALPGLKRWVVFWFVCLFLSGSWRKWSQRAAGAGR